MTDLIDHADTDDIPTGDPTVNIASHTYRLREFEERQRINPAYLHSAETLIIDTATGEPYKPARFVQLGHLADTWIFDELQDPPQPAPQPSRIYADGADRCGCCAHEQKPLGERGKRRRAARRVSPWFALVLAVAVGAGTYAGLALAAGLVTR